MSKPQYLDPVGGRYVQIDALDWAPFPPALCEGPIRWRLLNVSPEGRARGLPCSTARKGPHSRATSILVRASTT